MRLPALKTDDGEDAVNAIARRALRAVTSIIENMIKVVVQVRMRR